jgi:hypothetical protein
MLKRVSWGVAVGATASAAAVVPSDAKTAVDVDIQIAPLWPLWTHELRVAMANMKRMEIVRAGVLSIGQLAILQEAHQYINELYLSAKAKRREHPAIATLADSMNEHHRDCFPEA